MISGVAKWAWTHVQAASIGSQRRSKTAKSLRVVFLAGIGALTAMSLPLLWTARAAGQAGTVTSAKADAGQEATHETTMNDQTDLAVTVYNSNVALVRDTREIMLPTGDSRLRFMDIAASINPATVHFRSLGEPDKVSVLEQDYEYDLLDPEKLLQKYVGREVTLLHRVQNNGSTEWQEEKATLLADNGGPVWKIGNQIVTGLAADGYRFPDLPDNLYSRPTLLWMLANGGARKQKVEASYLANNVSWSADYVLNVARDDGSADLDGWVTLANNSGTAFRNAQLQLVAGELNRVQPQSGAMMELKERARAGAAPAPPMTQEAFSEYHLYTLTRRTSVFDKETKQLSLLHSSSFPVQKVYVVNGQNYYYRSASAPGLPQRDSVMVYYKFTNEEKIGLGMPLPAGTVRVYQADSRGGSLFAGEDNITHTPKDEFVSVHIGDAFDVVAERKQTDYKRLGTFLRDTYEMEYEITLRNHKDNPITVEVNEPIGGDWEMLNSTFPAKKTAAFAAQFEVPVAKDGTAVLRYRVRVHW
ncbi:MAG TPA: DUF4139 domain-containing protein [Candidatus Acidoferrales bacterium]|nr:DUF4139 domain-containing protein [Candidatus Acidoferrales bacterium]